VKINDEIVDQHDKINRMILFSSLSLFYKAKTLESHGAYNKYFYKNTYMSKHKRNENEIRRSMNE